MTKKTIDYSKALIYKIVCNDVTVKECYVGSTTSFTKRKCKHKNCCNNKNIKGHNYNDFYFLLIRIVTQTESRNSIILHLSTPCDPMISSCVGGDNLIIFGVLNYGKTMGISWGVGKLGTKA